jgi:hypothetical protein
MCGADHASAAEGSRALDPAVVTPQATSSTLSGMPEEIAGQITSFCPDSIRALRVASNALQHFGAWFLASNAEEIVASCSSAPFSDRSTLHRLVHDSLTRFQLRFQAQPDRGCIRFHFSVSAHIRSLGAACDDQILSAWEIGQFSHMIEIDNLIRSWYSIHRNVIQTHPDLQMVPGPGRFAQEIRNWMRADANQPVLQSIAHLNIRGWDIPHHRHLTCVPTEIRLLIGLQSLNLNHHELTSLPEAPFQELSRLQRLSIHHNHLNSLHERTFNGLVALQEISLATNHLISLPETLFQGLPMLRVISLSRNRLVSLPERLFQGLPSLQQLFLHFNPQLMLSLEVFLDEQVIKNHITFLETMRTFYNYVCESSLARVYQLVAGNASPEDVQRAFTQLPETVRNALFGWIWMEAGSPNVGDPQWGENHAFDDMQILGRALKRYVRERFDNLSDERNAIYGHVYDLARREPGAENINFDSPQWGEEHAREHILRLIDAMMRLQL